MRKFLLFTSCLLFFVVFSSSSLFAECYDTYGSYGCTQYEPGTVATSTQTLRTATTQTSKLISARVSKIISPGSAPRGRVQLSQLDCDPGYDNKKMSGLSAGDAPPKFGLWLNASYTETEDDSIAANSDSDLMLVMVGCDYKLTPNMVFGVAFGYEDSDTDTHFNQGDKDSEGFTLAPYFAYLITENVSISLSGGYTWLDYDQHRTDAYGNIVSSSLDSDRWFISPAVNVYKNLGALNVSFHLSYTFAEESLDSFTESNGNKEDELDISLDTLNLGVETSYFLGLWEPYVRLEYSYDTEYDTYSDEDYDKDFIRAGLGARFYFTQNLTGDLLLSTIFDHDDQSEESYMLNIRYGF